MTKQVDFKEYTKFVDAVTSDESRDFIAFSDRIVSLDEKSVIWSLWWFKRRCAKSRDRKRVATG